MNLHILCLYSPDFQPLAGLTVPLWQEYATRHAYHLVAKSLEHRNPGVPEQWAQFTFDKTAAVANYLRTVRPDVLWVIDVDMIPTNMEVRVHKMAKNYDAIALTRDINGLNSGSYLATVSVGALLWLDTVVAMRDCVKTEQGAMKTIEQAFLPITTFLHHPSINSIPLDEYDYGMHREDQGQWMPGHLTCHLPGKSNAERLAIFPKYIPQIIR